MYFGPKFDRDRYGRWWSTAHRPPVHVRDVLRAMGHATVALHVPTLVQNLSAARRALPHLAAKLREPRAGVLCAAHKAMHEKMGVSFGGDPAKGHDKMCLCVDDDELLV